MGHMGHLIESLEPRRLLSGGVDPSFGSSSGVAFAGPGTSPGVVDVRIDSAGRVLVGGQSSQGMFLTRLGPDGQPDTRFGVNGTVSGTPRALTSADFIVPLPAGGYIVASRGTGGQFGVARFKANGRIDPTFGRNGVARLDLNAEQVVLQPADGKIIVIGYAAPRVEANADRINYAVRLTADGLLDHGWGEAGWDNIGDEALGDIFFSHFIDVTSAFVDDAGRMVVAFDADFIHSDDLTGFIDGNAQVYLQRFNADGSLDGTFSNADANNPPYEAAVIVFNQPTSPQFDPSETGRAVLRHDRQIVVFRQQNDASSEQPVFVSLVDSAGTLTSSGAALGTLAPSFHPNLQATVLGDDSILLAGKKTSAGTSVPALLKLTANLVVDSSFGSGGILTLPNPGGQTDVTQVHAAPDGTAVAWASDPSRLVRVFADDRPVITLQRVRSDAQNTRFTVSIRAARAIDTTSLDDDDLRAVIEDGGGRLKLRLVNFVLDNASGVVTAIYRLNRFLLPFIDNTVSVTAVADQVSNDQGGGNLARDLGMLTLSYPA